MCGAPAEGRCLVTPARTRLSAKNIPAALSSGEIWESSSSPELASASRRSPAGGVFRPGRRPSGLTASRRLRPALAPPPPDPPPTGGAERFRLRSAASQASADAFAHVRSEKASANQGAGDYITTSLPAPSPSSSSSSPTAGIPKFSPKRGWTEGTRPFSSQIRPKAATKTSA